MHSIQAALILAPALILAQTDSSDYTYGTDDGYTMNLSTYTVDPTEYLSELYGTATPSGATGAVATSLASALYSHQLEMYTDAAYISAANDVYMAAATRSDADAIISSLDSDGVLNGDYTTADWYVDGVPASAKSELASYISGFIAVQTSVIGGAADATTTTSGTTAGTTATGTTGATTATSTGSAASGASASSTSSSTGGAHGPRATGGAVAGLAAVVAVGAAVLF